MNDIFHKIKEYIPDEEIIFRRHPITKDIEIVFIKTRAIMTVLKNNTWDEIKRHIDLKMKKIDIHDCSICFTDEGMKKRVVSCPKCSNYWCINCYIDIFKTNKGLIICPFCRYTYGYVQDDHAIKIGIEQMLNKTN